MSVRCGNFSDSLKMAKFSNVKDTKGIIISTLTINELFLMNLPTYWGLQIKKLSSGEKKSN